MPVRAPWAGAVSKIINCLGKTSSEKTVPKTGILHRVARGGSGIGRKGNPVDKSQMV